MGACMLTLKKHVGPIISQRTHGTVTWRCIETAMQNAGPGEETALSNIATVEKHLVTACVSVLWDKLVTNRASRALREGCRARMDKMLCGMQTMADIALKLEHFLDEFDAVMDQHALEDTQRAGVLCT